MIRILPIRLLSCALAAIGLTSSPAAARAETRIITSADYDRAARVLEPRLAAQIYNNAIAYRWADGGRTLLYTTNERGGPRHMRVDVATGKRSRVSSLPDPPKVDPGTLPSPDGNSLLLRRGDDLWVRDVARGTERRLTTDGLPYFSYGKLFDDSTRTIGTRRQTTPLLPFNTFWSPDGKWIFGHRNDERTVLPYPFVESVPMDGSFRPILHEIRTSLLGEPGRIVREMFVIDAVGEKRTIPSPAGWIVDSSPLGWSDDNTKVFVLGSAQDSKGRGLFEIDLRSGDVRSVITERSQTTSSAYFFNVFEYNYPNVRIINHGSEAIWFSQQGGRGQLYLYDTASGSRKRLLTPNEGTVIDIFHIDEERRKVFATLMGVERGRDPYQRDLYSIPLDHGSPVKLTSGRLDHDMRAPLAPFWAGIMTQRSDTGPVSPDGNAFVDIASDLDTPPVATLRSARNGAAIAQLEQADIYDATASGWRPPKRFTVRAADGKTDLWGAIYLPSDYDPSRKYPVVNALYGGPQMIVAPRNFNEAGPMGGIYGRSSLAQLGFFVVTLDGRGTPGRDLAFWEVGYGNFADPGIDDHVAAIRQLATRYSGMDLDRVGVSGHSFGGYVAARSMLRYPQFYKVGISSAAVHNWQGFRDAYEQYQGPVEYAGGTRLKPNANAVPESYRRLDNNLLAANLQGKLLIGYADLDENAPPATTLQFINALKQANRDYDLIYMPNGTHSFVIDPYFVRRSWDYFVEHLMGAKPPPAYQLSGPQR